MKILLIAISAVTAFFLGKEAVNVFKSPVLFQSLESKTVTGEAVYNKIKWFSDSDKDIWMMSQSHNGPQFPEEKWDRLAIIVDKKYKTAQFLQLKPGPLQWTEDLVSQQVPYRVSCFMCHANGPRAIRPTGSSLFAEAKILLWNFKIKSYGRLKEHPSHLKLDADLNMPFRHRTEIDNDTLQVKVCVYCHKESGFAARGTLTRQNAVTIQFLVESGIMPPFGIPISVGEKKEIQRFIRGF